jgi:hypothetical protein
MSESDDHELVHWLKDYAGEGDQPADAAFRHKFVHMNDQQRTTELQNFSSWLKDDSTLRRKAQLMKLGRELNHLHQAMRRAGR